MPFRQVRAGVAKVQLVRLMLDQFLHMRPVASYAQSRAPVRGLYLCGAGTHSGGGVTGANGFNAARVVLQQNR